MTSLTLAIDQHGDRVDTHFQRDGNYIPKQPSDTIRVDGMALSVAVVARIDKAVRERYPERGTDVLLSGDAGNEGARLNGLRTDLLHIGRILASNLLPEHILEHVTQVVYDAQKKKATGLTLSVWSHTLSEVPWEAVTLDLPDGTEVLLGEAACVTRTYRLASPVDAQDAIASDLPRRIDRGVALAHESLAAIHIKGCGLTPIVATDSLRVADVLKTIGERHCICIAGHGFRYRPPDVTTHDEFGVCLTGDGRGEPREPYVSNLRVKSWPMESIVILIACNASHDRFQMSLVERTNSVVIAPWIHLPAPLAVRAASLLHDAIGHARSGSEVRVCHLWSYMQQRDAFLTALFRVHGPARTKLIIGDD